MIKKKKSTQKRKTKRTLRQSEKLKEQGKDKRVEKNQEKTEEWKSSNSQSAGHTHTQEQSKPLQRKEKATTNVHEKWISKRKKKINGFWAVCNFRMTHLHSTYLLSIFVTPSVCKHAAGWLIFSYVLEDPSNRPAQRELHAH